jgi:carboxyl-terminal processing protease
MTNAKQQKSIYNNILSDAEGGSNSSALWGSVVIIALFSVLAGLFGFYLGDRGLIKRSYTERSGQNDKADTYSDEELRSKINQNAYDFELYNQVIANLKDKYVDPSKIKDEELFNGSMKGLVESVGDHATSYFSPKDYAAYLDSFSSKFEGIGVRLEYRNNIVVVEEVFEGSPAQKSGVEIGYIFSKVDGKDLSNATIEEVVSKVKGPAGTEVNIQFIDPENGEKVDKKISRAAITVDSMRLVEKDKDTVVFEVSRFTEDTIQEWEAKWDKNADEIVSKGYKNIVLDMRSNGGGFLDAAIYAANDFLEPNKLVVAEKTRDGKTKENKTQKSNPRFKGKNVVILINGGTASASEILAGAVKFHNGYKILGSKSFGKGTVQKTYDLPNGGALKITTEYWLLPDGKKLDNDNPISPDIEITQDLDSYKKGQDVVLDKAMELFK